MKQAPLGVVSNQDGGLGRRLPNRISRARSLVLPVSDDWCDFCLSHRRRLSRVLRSQHGPEGNDAASLSARHPAHVECPRFRRSTSRDAGWARLPYLHRTRHDRCRRDGQRRKTRHEPDPRRLRGHGRGQATRRSSRPSTSAHRTSPGRWRRPVPLRLPAAARRRRPRSQSAASRVLRRPGTTPDRSRAHDRASSWTIWASRSTEHVRRAQRDPQVHRHADRARGSRRDHPDGRRRRRVAAVHDRQAPAAPGGRPPAVGFSKPPAESGHSRPQQKRADRLGSTTLDDLHDALSSVGSMAALEFIARGVSPLPGRKCIVLLLRRASRRSSRIGWGLAPDGQRAASGEPWRACSPARTRRAS